MTFSRLLLLGFVGLASASDDTSLVQVSVNRNADPKSEALDNADAEAERKITVLAAETAERASAAARTAADRLTAEAHTEADRIAAARADQVAVDVRRAADEAKFESTRASSGGVVQARDASAKARAASSLAVTTAERAGVKLEKPEVKQDPPHMMAEVVGGSKRAAKAKADVDDKVDAKSKAGAVVESPMEVQLSAEHLSVPKDMPQEGLYSHLLQAKSKFEHLGEHCHEKASAIECESGRRVIDALLGMTSEEGKRFRGFASVKELPHFYAENELEKNMKKVLKPSVLNIELAETREGDRAVSGVSTFNVEKALVFSATYSVAFNHWLYNPGPFELLDLDRNKSITYLEATEAIKTMTGGGWPGGRYMFNAMDTDRDGVLSRHDVHSFLRGALFIREYVPELDLVRPDANLTQLLFLANQNTNTVFRPKLAMPVKFMVVFSIPIICYILSSFASSLWRRKAGAEVKAVM